jgi:uncharacterized SAM-binding protein YcdF (DUF218 family)
MLSRMRWVAVSLLVLVLMLVVGFLSFVRLINSTHPGRAETADGIVVLTGGASRVSKAIRLLAAGRGRRLLISGVHPETTEAMLGRVNPEARRLLTCCIDLDRNARDTIENADETRRWLRERGFRSVIVVTSSYHMPRGLVELRRALPRLKLIPHPVEPSKLQMNAWWAHTRTFRLLATEFVKYLASLGRCSSVRLMGGDRVLQGVRGCFDPLAG